MRALIIGCGYTGLPLGEMLARAGHEVYGLRRSASCDEDLAARGIQPIHADITQPASLPDDGRFDAVINLTSSSKGGLDEYRAVYLNGTRNILEWLRAQPPAIYLHASSTSVYGQTDGSWVTEESPTRPANATSQVLAEAENELFHAHREIGFPAVILRAAGIYGPDRGHLFLQYLRGEATLRGDGENWLNMIHLEDLARAIAWLIPRGVAGQIYNLADEEPVRQIDFFAWLAAKLGKPMPPSAPLDPGRKRGLTHKRVSCAKLKAATGFTFTHPTFREGYSAEMRRLGLAVCDTVRGGS